jgi:exopolyphosphatase/pppGpp-phosphohydrolase
MDYIFLDIGSYTVKPYRYKNKKLTHLQDKSILFKNNFKEGKLAKEDVNNLIYFVTKLRKEFPKALFKAYATSVFRDLENAEKGNLIQKIYDATGLLIMIIDQTSENIYMQKALVGKYNTKKNILIINIGGGSTQLSVLSSMKTVEMVNVKLGAGTLLNAYPSINSKFSEVSIEKVITYVKQQLPDINHKTSVAFYSGGELDYMQKVKYPITQNKLFKDELHPYKIRLKKFSFKNAEIFNSISLTDLENFMPENPKWMVGARACSALSQAICEKYSVSTIIPSNVNIIDGVVRYEFR